MTAGVADKQFDTRQHHSKYAVTNKQKKLMESRREKETQNEELKSWK